MVNREHAEVAAAVQEVGVQSSRSFFAHSVQHMDRAGWHVLLDHLRGTAERCERFADAFGAGEAGQIAGLLHDLGKYSTEFQRYLTGEGARVEHSTAGAKIAAEHWQNPLGRMIAYCIAGHHAGLANARESGARGALLERLRCEFGKHIPALCPDWQQEIKLPAQISPPPLQLRDAERTWFQFAFLVRMLFSCLVDADYLDTEAFYATTEGRNVERAGHPRLAMLREQLDRHLLQFDASTAVNELRAEVLDHVRRQAAERPGLFSLTVPTGGGKTLTSLAFALDHAVAHGLNRVIYVIPFTSIIEQNAEVFRNALGDFGESAVLEHHSAFIDDRSRALEARDKLRLAMENWDAPIIVTTAVQFFESLFGDRPSQCRKLHRIANSVIILDEAQTLPLKLLRPCVAALDELALNYKASVILCTATQPALAETDDSQRSFRGGLRGVRELAPNPPRLYERLKRVVVRSVDLPDDAAIAKQLLGNSQILCVVNNRRHARALYTAIADEPGACHLSTLMCAAHRSILLRSIKEELGKGHPCRLIATSLIEAGVDIDFPLVLRAEAGLDAIAQAAGRCNREGRRPSGTSEVRIFQAPQWPPPPELIQFAQVAREVLRNHKDDPLSLSAIEEYFRLLYWQREAGGDSSLDAHNVLGRMHRSRMDVPFEDIAREFRMIESHQVPIIVPYDERARHALDALVHAERIGYWARRLQPYVTQIPKQPFEALLASGAVQPISRERFGEQFFILAATNLYSKSVGLTWDDPVFIESEMLMW